MHRQMSVTSARFGLCLFVGGQCKLVGFFSEFAIDQQCLVLSDDFGQGLRIFSCALRLAAQSLGCCPAVARVQTPLQHLDPDLAQATLGVVQFILCKANGVFSCVL